MASAKPKAKSVLITGCSTGGIGYALAQEFQKRGLTVFATARTLSKMSGLEKLPNTTLFALDVSSPTDIASAVELVKTATGGRLDYLVNNSGQNYVMPFLDQDIEQAKRMFEVNFWGVFRMIQGFAPLLIEAKGTIVNIGSIVSYLHSPFLSTYCASKAGLHQFDEVLRLELTPLGINVLTVVTGAVDTNINSNSGKYKLPPTSPYTASQKYLETLFSGEDEFRKMKPPVFAQKVVGDVLAGSTGKIWRGASSTLTYLASTLMPMSLIDRIMIGPTGLDKMSASKT